MRGEGVRCNGTRLRRVVAIRAASGLRPMDTPRQTSSPADRSTNGENLSLFTENAAQSVRLDQPVAYLRRADRTKPASYHAEQKHHPGGHARTPGFQFKRASSGQFGGFIESLKRQRLQQSVLTTARPLMLGSERRSAQIALKSRPYRRRFIPKLQGFAQKIAEMGVAMRKKRLAVELGIGKIIEGLCVDHTLIFILIINDMQPFFASGFEKFGSKEKRPPHLFEEGRARVL